MNDAIHFLTFPPKMNDTICLDERLWNMSPAGLSMLEATVCESIIRNNDCLSSRLYKYDELYDKLKQIPFRTYWAPMTDDVRANMIQYETALYESHLSSMRYYIDVSKRWIRSNQRLLSDMRLVRRACHNDPESWRVHLPDDLRNIVLSYLVASPLTIAQIHAEEDR